MSILILLWSQTQKQQEFLALVIAQGPIIHPVNPEVNGVYTVLKWSFNSQNEALKPIRSSST